MVHVAREDLHGECLHLPSAAVQFPVHLRPPPGFRPDDLSTWPPLEGRLEYLDGRIEYMPPCGGVQQDVAVDLVGLLFVWARERAGYLVGGNEAGMLLEGDVRAADAAVWRRADLGPSTHQLRRVPPVLAAEVAGGDEGEAELREKARWYLAKGVGVVWLVLPDSREVVVMTGTGEWRYGATARLAPHPALPDLAPEVRELFRQLERTV